jgi:hypothetical protein
MMVGPPGLPPSESVEAASWIHGRLHPFGSDAGSVVPGGFEAYARIDHAPREGVLPPLAASALARVLAEHTTTPEVCWFCLWEGYGYLTPGAAVKWLEAPHPAQLRRPAGFRIVLRRRADPAGARPRVKLPHRDYILYRGPIESAVGWPDGPNLWWPEDRAWCVASEIDLARTYIGATVEAITAVVADRQTNALPASLDEAIAKEA